MTDDEKKRREYHYNIHFYGPHNTVIYAPGVKISSQSPLKIIEIIIARVIFWLR